MSTRLRPLLFGACAMSAALPLAAIADPVTETVMHPFAGTDGAFPARGALTLSKDGQLYGTTEQGGAQQFGAIFRVAADGSETLLYSFTGGADGIQPGWGLARDKKGNFYGMSNGYNNINRGTVFKITPAGVFTTLHAFDISSVDGYANNNTVALGADGRLYGVTSMGGTNSNCGTFFRLNTDGSGFTVLHDFVWDNTLVCNPQGGIVLGSDGNFYGLATTYLDQTGVSGYGGVYRITPAGALTTLYGFTNGTDDPPKGMPTLDAAGNIYFFGVPRNTTMHGRVYRLAGGVLSTLHDFTTLDGTPGDGGSLLLAKDGRLYGTTTSNGSNDAGTVFSLGLDGLFAMLHAFGASATDGSMPDSGPAAAADGSLWGTTRVGGGNIWGSIYRLTPPTARLTVKPATIALGQSATLKWSSTDTAACTASGAWGSGAEPVSGSLKVTPAAAGSYTYTLACNGAGTATRSVTLTVQ